MSENPMYYFTIKMNDESGNYTDFTKKEHYKTQYRFQLIVTMRNKNLMWRQQITLVILIHKL